MLLGLLLGLALAVDLPAANGQITGYPDKPVKIFVGFAAGGGTDVAASRWVNRSWWRTVPAQVG
jgi:tripartite-type tricarboxylate transporter receptor subunit TctC